MSGPSEQKKKQPAYTRGLRFLSLGCGCARGILGIPTICSMMTGNRRVFLRDGPRFVARYPDTSRSGAPVSDGTERGGDRVGRGCNVDGR